MLMFTCTPITTNHSSPFLSIISLSIVSVICGQMSKTSKDIKLEILEVNNS